MQNPIVIVRQGGMGTVPAEEGGYDDYIKLLQNVLKGGKFEGRFGEGEEKIVTVEVVADVGDALLKLMNGGTLIFISGSMIQTAQGVKAHHPELRVIVLQSLMPTDELEVLRKEFLTDPKALRDYFAPGAKYSS